ncbi:serine/threonine protein kinase [Mycobacterium sp. PS03-16]|uniref:serine/threonine-protein kinase n=1 Tax=Mycobacterium sp. PS03-16 TaxID=2559611 RepID=UPI00107453C1|nr:serine/threonine-protein kinase [Mycobacterium sp. PS03-16]TFV57177.1 serine/threonine protein kinase [Mycobacterium sp. PS03-16]
MQAPEILGDRYELRGTLGRGGMAVVRDGWDRRLDRAVAVKLMHPSIGADSTQRERFECEARSAAALNHPNVVAVHDCGDHDGTPFIVMERLPGRTLADVIARGPMSPGQVRAVLDNVLAALAAAHAAGFLHRDIKPANILFTELGDTKVADFGIAKSGDSVQTMSGQVFGTMAYLSPERIAGRPATVSDDLYAVGVVGYEALTGRRLFPQDNLAQLARAVCEQPIVPLTQLRPDVDPALATTIERAMSRDPQWRFTDARAMRDALAGLVPVGAAPLVAAAAAPVPPMRPPTRVLTGSVPPGMLFSGPPPPVAGPPVPMRRYGGLLAVAAVLVALVAGLAVLVAQSSAESTSPAPAPTPARTSLPAPSATSPPPPVTSQPPPIFDRNPGWGNGNGPPWLRGGDDDG